MGETATITFTFSEDPGSTFTWNGTTGDVVVSGGTLSAIAGSGLTRTATFTPTASTNSGTASITVASGAYTDTAGNTGGAGVTPSLDFDTLTPNAPSTPDLTNGSDNGISNTDDISNVSTPTLSGTAESGSTVTLYDTNGTTVLGSATSTDGTWSITSATLSAGSHTLTAKSTDAAGNVSNVSSGLTLTVDTTAPTLVITSDVSQLKVSETATITFTFSEDPGSTFTWDGTSGDVVVSGGTLGAISGSGLTRTATFTPTASTNNGTASITVASASYTDTAGNIGGAGTTPALSFDTLLPDAPSTPDLASGSDTGISNTDDISNTTTPTFTGTAETGSTVTLYDTNGTSLLGSTTATDGTWSITSSTLSAGSHTLTAKATDAAGNVSTVSSGLTLTVDTTAPTLAITSNASQLKVGETATITFIFSEDPGSTFTWDGTAGDVVVSGGTLGAISGSGLTRTATFTPTVSTNSGTASITVASGSYTDTAGNTGGAGTTPSINFDTLLPDAPSTPDLASGSDTGISNTDDISNTATPTFTGTAETGSTVTLYDTNGTTVLGSTTATDGTWSITSSTLSAGSHTLTAKATDAAGNVSTVSSGLTLTVNTTAPTLAITSNASGLKIGETATISFSFNEDPGSTFTWDGTSGDVVVSGGTLSAISGSGLTRTATFTPTTSTNNGTASIAVASGAYIDTAGNTGGAGVTPSLIFDTLAPNAPSTPDLSNGSDSGISNTDDISNITTPTFTGTAESGSTVTLYDTDNTTVLGTATATDGNWSITSSNLNLGSHTITAKTTDIAGNISIASSGLTVNIDPTAPTISLTTVPNDATYPVGHAIDFSVSYSEAVAVNISGGTPYIDVSLDTGGLVHAAYVSGTGTSTLTFRYIVAAGNIDSNGINAANIITLNGGTIQDNAGNLAATTGITFASTTNVLVDGIAPSALSITRASSSSSATTNTTSQEYTISFSENVSGIDISDFSLISTGNAAGTIASINPINASIYTVTVNNISGDGTLGLVLKNTGTNIVDTSGNTISTGYNNGEVYTFDHTTPVVSANGISLSGASGINGTYKIGDTITATWDNSSSGDNNSDISSGVTVNFSEFGGETTVAATNNSGIWTASYTLTAGNTTALNRNISITTTDTVGNSTTTTSTTNATVDTIAPAFSSSSSATVQESATPGTVIIDLNADNDQNISYSLIGGTGASLLNLNSATGVITLANEAMLNFENTPSYSALVRATDAAGNKTDQTLNIAIANVNDRPIVTHSNSSASFTEGYNTTSTSIVIDNTLTISDQDSPTLTSATLSIQGNFQADQDLLTFTNNNSSMGNIIGSYNTSTGILSLSSSGATATLNQWQNALRSVSYTNLSKSPDTAPRTISMIVNDGVDSSSTITQTVNVISTNDTPTLTVPVAQNTDREVPLVFSSNNNNALYVNDVDAGNGTIQVTLTAAHGTITLPSTTGLSFDSGSGTNDTSLTVQGTVSNINAALNGLIFSPETNFHGTASLQLITHDQGLTGSGGDQSASSSVDILVHPVYPLITSVDSISADGSYKIGDTINITVSFDQTIAVDTTKGTPILRLKTGGTARVASYISGSGSSTLTFSYTVQAGDISTDLDIRTINALVLNGATFLNAAGETAVLTLPTPGSDHSLAGQRNLVIDGIAPTVTSVNIPADGTYIAGQNLDFIVNYSEVVNVDTSAGTPRLAVALDTGGTVYANYMTGSGTSALTFRLTVAQNQLDSTGITITSNTENNSGSIRDTVGNTASTALTNTAATASIYIDAINPLITSITRLDSEISQGGILHYRVTVSEDVTNVTAATFKFTTSGVVNASITGITPIDAHTYDVTINAVGSGDLRLDLANSVNGVSDAAGNTLQSPFTAGERYTLRPAPVVVVVSAPPTPLSSGSSTTNISSSSGTSSSFGSSSTFSLSSSTNSSISISNSTINISGSDAPAVSGGTTLSVGGSTFGSSGGSSASFGSMSLGGSGGFGGISGGSSISFGSGGMSGSVSLQGGDSLGGGGTFSFSPSAASGSGSASSNQSGEAPSSTSSSNSNTSTSGSVNSGNSSSQGLSTEGSSSSDTNSGSSSANGTTSTSSSSQDAGQASTTGTTPINSQSQDSSNTSTSDASIKTTGEGSDKADAKEGENKDEGGAIKADGALKSSTPKPGAEYYRPDAHRVATLKTKPSLTQQFNHFGKSAMDAEREAFMRELEIEIAS